jgi:hypothetical protein
VAEMTMETSDSASTTALSRRASDSFTSSERAWTLSETQLKLRSHSTRLPPNMERVFTVSTKLVSIGTASPTRMITPDTTSASASAPAAARALS